MQPRRRADSRAHSPVRSVLRQAALQMNIPEQAHSPRGISGDGGSGGTLGGPEFQRVRSSLRQLKMDAKEGYHHALDYDARALVDHVNGQLRSVQRAFVVLSETIEDELGQLRGADAQQWEQLKLHASHHSEAEELKGDLDRTRAELAKLHTAHSNFVLQEHAAAIRRVDDLETEQTELRRELAAARKEWADERTRMHEELASLRRWRADVVGPFVEDGGRAVQQHGLLLPQLQKARQLASNRRAVSTGARGVQNPELEGNGGILVPVATSPLTTCRHHPPHYVSPLPPSLRVARPLPNGFLIWQAAAELDDRVSKEIPQLFALCDEGRRSQQEDTARSDSQLEALADAQAQQLDAHRSVRDEVRRLMDDYRAVSQLKLEVESQAESLRLLAAEGSQLRQDFKDELEPIGAIAKAAQATASQSAEELQRSVSALSDETRELQESEEATSEREAQIPADPSRSQQIPADPSRSQKVPEGPRRSQKVPEGPSRSQ